MAERLLPGLERRLRAEIEGGVHFDRFTRGRYATDASHYQIMPIGVVTPRTTEDAERAIAICRAEGAAVTARGGGSSQAGPDRQQLRHHRLLQASHAHSATRRRRPPLRGGARHRARRAQPGAQAPRAVVSGRRLDRLARHHRRHGREQFLRRALAALRQHPGERHLRSTRCSPTAPRRISARRRATCPICRRIRRSSRWRPTCSRSARARPARSRRAFPRCSAGSAATISTRCCRGETTSTSRTFWSAPRVRSPSPRRSN